MDAVNQHYVPQFLLNRFAKNGQMRAYDLETGKSFTESVKHAASLNHFNRIENPDEEPSNDLERLLTKVEGMGATVIRALVEDRVWPLKQEQRDALATFVIFQAVRTKRMRDAAQELTDLSVQMLASKVTKAEVKAAYEAVGQTLTEDELHEEWQEWREMKATAHHHLHLQTMLHVAQAAFPILQQQRALGFVQFEHRALLTSDHPVALYSSLASDSNGIGIETAEEIWLPIDRRAAVVFTTELERDIKFVPTAKLAKRINGLVAEHARQWLYHHRDDKPFSDLETMPKPHPLATVLTPKMLTDIDALYPDDD